MTQYTVLSTKKLLPSLKKDAMQEGIAIMEQEFISVRPVLSDENKLAVKELIGIKNLTAVFTSSNAVESFLKLAGLNGLERAGIHWNIFCLQGATKDAIVTQLPGCNILGTAADSGSLAIEIIEHDSMEKLVFFCGNKRRDELPRLLKTNNIYVQELVIYETIETPVLVPGPLDAVLFFSPSAVNSFFSMNSLEKDTACFAIGDTTAKAIASYTRNKIISSEVADQSALVQSLCIYFQNINIHE